MPNIETSFISFEWLYLAGIIVEQNYERVI